MPNWLRKTLVILITVFTLGTVAPPPHLLAESDERSSTESAEAIANRDYADITLATEEKLDSDLSSKKWQEVAATYKDPSELQDAFITYTVQQATEQTKEKFGERIEAKSGTEFRTVILPKIEETIIQLSDQLHEGELRNLTISERPTKGKSEKIFHITNATTHADVFRLHVRRENPPGQGHWFSFHYHEASDNFESHHELGNIYWDKNTPPNWMS